MENKDTIQIQHRHLLCLRSLFAGLGVAFLTHMILSALGAGIGGMTAHSLIMREEGGAGLATSAGVWMGLSVVVSLFVGSFFAIRLSQFRSYKIGYGHGAVIAALFFIVMAWGASMGIGSVVSGLSQTAMAASHTAASIAAIPAVQDTFQKAIGASELRSQTSEVTLGLASRLMSGDEASARSYLAYQTGQTEAQVQQQAATMKAEFDANLKAAAEKTADMIAVAGWSLFVTMVLGLASAILGGALAARANVEKEFVTTITLGEGRSFRNELAHV